MRSRAPSHESLRPDRLLFPPGHRLAGLNFHALRHFGMTMWLRRSLPLKLVEKWGGWHSLKVMLDVYAAMLPDAVALLEASPPIGGRLPSPHDADNIAAEPPADAAG